jgi:glycosyltransferase involved in cell wall biosynthesis
LNITFVTDPLVTSAGAVRPALLLSKEFKKNGYDVTFVSSQIDVGIAERLQREGIHCRRIGSNFSFIASIPTFDAWARRLIWQKPTERSRDADLVVNTSSCTVMPAEVYYAQGPMMRALKDISKNMPAHYKYPLKLFTRPLDMLEKHLIQKFRNVSKAFVANSGFCASMYEDLNVAVDKIVYPPLDCSLFEPSTMKPSADYVLTHLGIYGKEGNFEIVKAIADAGVPVKVFGRTSFVPESLKTHSNLHFLGKVSDRELVELYSNALYTLFAFGHEPFGYIPVESMACGTPILTYDRQGPSETVVHLKTGWQEHSNRQLVYRALDLWKNGYLSRMRTECRNRALMYDTRRIAEKWIDLLGAHKVDEQNLVTMC